ncbi:MAG: isoamylase early set domain-containing protein [Candidatus Margulisiibacteriota bacterium]
MARKKRVTFKFKAPAGVCEVKLCGNFTNWEQGAIVMTKGKSGEWKAQVSLEPGEYEYKFLADGVWYVDPSSERQVQNNLGTENSVRLVR